MRPNQTYKLLHNKGNQENRWPTKWEEIVAKDITNRGLIA